MFVSEKIVVFIGKDKRTYSKKRLVLKCDLCQNVFELKYSLKNRNRQFCSRLHADIASRKNGQTYSKKIETWRKTLGVDHPSKSIIIKQKKVETCRKNFGVDYPLQSPTILNAAQKTLFDRLGVISPIQNLDVKAQIKETNLKKFGVENVFSSPEIREKIKLTSIAKYGCKVPSMSNVVKETTALNNFKKYGCYSTFQLDDVKQKIKNTCIKKYGVANTAVIPTVVASRNSLAARQKAHETMKKRGNYGKSKIEDLFYEQLCEMFPLNVTRQVLLNGWMIDFYVKNIDTFIQFDGIYWHGLDRPISKIESSSSLRDNAILKKYLFDKRQNEWFKMNNKKLVRVTDFEFKSNTAWKERLF